MVSLTTKVMQIQNIMQSPQIIEIVSVPFCYHFGFSLYLLILFNMLGTYPNIMFINTVNMVHLLQLF